MKVISRDAVLRILDEMYAGVALRMIVGDLPASDLVSCEHCVYARENGKEKHYCTLSGGDFVEACIDGMEVEDD